MKGHKPATLPNKLAIVKLGLHHMVTYAHVTSIPLRTLIGRFGMKGNWGRVIGFVPCWVAADVASPGATLSYGASIFVTWAGGMSVGVVQSLSSGLWSVCHAIEGPRC